MSPDVIMVVGFALLVLAIPAIISAWSDRRAPRLSAILLVWGGGMVLYATALKPGGYRWDELPDVIYTVLAQIIP